MQPPIDAADVEDAPADCCGALPFYRAEEFEDPFYTLLITLGQDTISAVDYEICASCDAASFATLIAAFLSAADASGTDKPSFDTFMDACRLHLLGSGTTSREGNSAALQPLDLELDECDEGAPQEAYSSPPCEDTEQHDDTDAQQWWTCTRCKFDWNPWEMETCRTCAASCYCEETPLVGGAVVRADADAATGTLELAFPSLHALQTALGGCDMLRVFEVYKSSGGIGTLRTTAAMRGKKKRYAVVHCARGALLLYDSMPAYAYVTAGCTGPRGVPRLVQHDATMLYRVERLEAPSSDADVKSDLAVQQRRGGVRVRASRPILRLYFFREAHPLDLWFDGHETRERCLELLMLLRQQGTPVLWCPSLCRQSYDTTILRFKGAPEDGMSSLPLKPVVFAASRSPYEVVRVFATCITLDADGELPMAQLEPLFRIRPECDDEDDAAPPPPPDADADNAHVVCVAIQRLSAANIKQLSVVRKNIPNQILDILGTRGYYLVLNSADNMNAFAGLDGLQGDPCAARSMTLVFVRKTAMHKLSAMACWSEAVAPTRGEGGGNAPEQHVSSAASVVTVSFRFLESLVVVAAVDTRLSDADDADTAVKHMAMATAIGGSGKDTEAAGPTNKNSGSCAPNLNAALMHCDYALLMGHWGYSTSFVKGTLEDELEPEIAATHILSEFEQALPMRPWGGASYGVPGHTRIAWRCLHRRLRRIVACASQFDTPGVDSCESTASCSLRLYALRCYALALLPIGSLPAASLFLSHIVVRSDVLLQGCTSRPANVGQLSLRIASPCFGAGVSYTQPLRPLHAGQWQTPECFSGIPLVGAAFEWAMAHAVFFEILRTDGGGVPQGAEHLLGSAVVPLRDVLQASMRGSCPSAAECDTALYHTTIRIGTVHLAVAWGNGGI